jgi:hypothetical protein
VSCPAAFESDSLTELSVARYRALVAHRDRRSLAALEKLCHAALSRLDAAWARVQAAALELSRCGGSGHALAWRAKTTPIWRLYKAEEAADGPGGVSWWIDTAYDQRPALLIELEAGQALARSEAYARALEQRSALAAEELDRRMRLLLRRCCPMLERGSGEASPRRFPLRVLVNGRSYWYAEVHPRRWGQAARANTRVTEFQSLGWVGEPETVEVRS